MSPSPAPHRLAILALPGFVLFDLAILQTLFAQTCLPDGDRPTRCSCAAAVGFGSAAAFRERFRRLVGVSPTAWRETYGSGTGPAR